MSVRLVVGRAGSGKTAWCHREIVSRLREQPLGSPVYWVVPRQTTFSTERWLACDSGLTASARCRVVSFDRLADEVLAEFPGPVRAVLSPTARRAVVAHVLRQLAGELSFFGPSADRPGLAGEVVALLDELNRDGFLEGMAEASEEHAADNEDEPDDPLRRAIEGLADGDEPLRRKLDDLRKIRDAYEAFLGSERFDVRRRMLHVLRHVGRCRRLRGASFYIDGFLEFMDFERRMVGAICQTAVRTGGEVTVTLMMPTDSPVLSNMHHLPPDDSLFHRVERTCRDLMLMLAGRSLPVEVVRLSESVRFRSRRLVQLEQQMACPGAAAGGLQVPEGGATDDLWPALVLRTAATPEAEVEKVAHQIRALTFATAGSARPPYRLRDIAVLARDLGPYQRAIERRFSAYGIPFFIDRRLDASAHPVVRLVRALLMVATSGPTTESMLVLCRTGRLPGTAPEAVSVLTRWCLERQPSDDAWTSSERRFANAPPLFVDLRSRVGPMLKRWFESWAGPMEMSAACLRLLEVVRELGVVFDPSDDEDVRLFAAVFGDGGILEELSETLSGQAISAPIFADTVAAALDGLDLGMVPPTVDQVLVGQAERTRPGRVPVVFVLGLADGMFPARPAESHLLPDRERRRLEAVGLGLRASARSQSRDERLIAYLALTRASERLVVSRPLSTTGGTALAASSLWDWLASSSLAAPAATPTSDTAESSGVTSATPGDAGGGGPAEADRENLAHPILSACTWAEFVSAVTSWVSKGAAEDVLAAAAYEAIRSLRRTNASLSEAVERLWPSLTAWQQRLQLPADVVGGLYGTEGVAELSCESLAVYAECPFRYFVREVLRPHQPRPNRVQPYLMARVIRRSYEAALRALAGPVGREDSSDPAALMAELQKRCRVTGDAETAELIRQLTDDGSTDRDRLPPEGKYLIDQIVGQTQKLLEAEVAGQQRTKFRPRDLALRFGRGGRLPPLRVATPTRPLHLGGVIHRLDADDAERALLWSLSTSSRESVLLPWLYHGLRLGLLASMLLAEQLIADGRPELGRAVAGAVELPMLRRWRGMSDFNEYVKEREKDAEALRAMPRKARGVLLAEAATSLDHTLPKQKVSAIFQLRTDNGGKLERTRSDVFSASELSTLLEHGREVLAELGGRLLTGDVTPKPYRLGQQTACRFCDYRPMCRFDPRNGGTYVELIPNKALDIRTSLENRCKAPSSPAPSAAGGGT